MSSKVASFLSAKFQNWSNPPNIHCVVYICIYICTSAMDTISLGKLVITWDEFAAVRKTLYRHTARCGEGAGHSRTITTGTQLLL